MEFPETDSLTAAWNLCHGASEEIDHMVIYCSIGLGLEFYGQLMFYGELLVDNGHSSR